jgi:predicted transcriptional regulator YdeE
MTDRPNPVFQKTEEVLLIGMMVTYNSQAEAAQGIPQQWRTFPVDHPALESSSNLYGASPCTGDRKIHYLTGVAHGTPESVVVVSLRLSRRESMSDWGHPHIGNK